MKRKVKRRESSDRARPGCFYAVGIGPGASDLLTLRAARLIKTADVILAPRSEASRESLALKTIRGLVNGQKVIRHSYPMARNAARTDQCWREAADLVVRECRAGRSVVQITVGDPLLYSTSVYLIEHLRHVLSPSRIHVVPGITAFQAMAARFGEALAIQEDRLMLMPATDMRAVDRALKHCETLVLYKAGPRLRQLISLLKRRGLLANARLGCNVEQPDREIMFRKLSERSKDATAYMSTVIVHVGRRSWSDVAGRVQPGSKRRWRKR